MTERENTSAQLKGRSDRGTLRQGQRHWFVESLPRNILADTGPIFALIHAGDVDHGRAVQFARGFAGRLITTWPVLTEVSYLLDQSDRRGVAVLFDMILDGHLCREGVRRRSATHVLCPRTPTSKQFCRRA